MNLPGAGLLPRHAERRTIRLHTELRTRTRAWHQQVERSFDAFDPRAAEGLRAMTDAHCMVIDRLLPDLVGYPVYRNELVRLRGLSGTSNTSALVLHSLGRPDVRPAIHPLAIAYVVLGSRLGARMIAKAIPPECINDSPEAVRFMTDEGSAAAWRRLRQDLADVASPEEAEQIGIDAEAVFRLYHDAAAAVKTIRLRGAA